MEKTKNIEEAATIIVDAAIKVHKSLGPGLLESAYQKCHVYELRKRGLRVETEVIVPIIYDGENVDAGYRIDALVEDMVAIENKAVEHLLPLHEAQLVTYMRLRNLRLGFLLNSNVVLMKRGIPEGVLRTSVWSMDLKNYKPSILCVLCVFAVPFSLIITFHDILRRSRQCS